MSLDLLDMPDDDPPDADEFRCTKCGAYCGPLVSFCDECLFPGGKDPDAPEGEPETTTDRIFVAPVPVQAAVIHAEIVPEPASLISADRILQRMEGITAADRAQAALLGHQALAITAITDDATEVLAGALIDRLTDHQARLESKVRPFADLAFKLHRALTGFIGQATEDLTKGLAHLRPMLAQRIRAKQDAERQRQADERAKAMKAQQEQIAREAKQAEAAGESPAVVQAIREEAKTLPPPPVAARPVTAVKGASTRDNWKAEVTSKRDLILHVAARLQASDDAFLHLLDVDMTTANQLARAQKETMAIPGLRAFNDVAFTKRRG